MRERKRWMPVALAALVVLGLSAHATVGVAGSKPVVVAVLKINTYALERNWEFAFKPEQLSPLAASILTSELVDQKGFRVVERSYVQQILDEQDMSASDRFDAQSAARMGRLLGAQVVALGDITSFQRSRKSVGLGGIGRGIGVGDVSVSKEAVTTEISVRLVDAQTGEVLASAHAKGKKSSAGLSGLTGVTKGVVRGDITTQQIEGAASAVLQDALRKVARELAKKAEEFDLAPVFYCLDGKVVRVSGSKVYLNVGARAGVERGDYFDVGTRGEEIIDPDTGESLGFDEEKKGTIRITQVKDKLSIGEFVEGGGASRGDVAWRSGGPDHPDVESVPNPALSAKHASQSGGSSASASATASPGSERAGGEGGNERSAIRAADASAADVGAAGGAPRAETNVAGLWRLDASETARYWCRSAVGVYAASRDACDEVEKDEDFRPFLDGLRNLHMKLELEPDGSFHLEWKDPATLALTTVEGTWRLRGLRAELAATRLDGVAVDSAGTATLKMGEGHLFGIVPNQNAYAAFMVGQWTQQIAWPGLAGVAFSRARR